MDVLVLGGSVFVGRAVVAQALLAGADVTVFNRGRTAPTPAGVTQLRGDRAVGSDLAALRDRHFDLVIDTCGYVPSVVDLTARLLAPAGGHYCFVSTINVFPGWPESVDYGSAGPHQGDPDATLAPSGLRSSASYGWLKSGCELAVLRAFGADHCSILRAGSIVGPHDGQTGRLPWWIARVARGGDVLVPGHPDDPMALIDARDLALFALSATPGTFEATGPSGRDTRADLMRACAEATGSSARLRYVGDDWLAAQDVTPWTEVPLWAPNAPGLFAHRADGADGAGGAGGAAQAGLGWRPLRDTVADTWEWMRQVEGGWRPAPDTPGLSPEREARLLTQWSLIDAEKSSVDPTSPP